MPRPQRLAEDWVRHARQLFPDLAPALDRAGILDAESYLVREASLPVRLRAEIGRIRHDLTLIGACEVQDQARASAPWVSALALGQIRIPARIRDALAPRGVRLVSDLERFSDRDLLQTHGLTRAGLRTLSLGLLVANRTRPMRAVREEPNTDRLRDLLSGAPDRVLLTPIDHLTGLRPRSRRSLREAGIRSLGDLQGVSERQLLAMPGMGPGGILDLILSVRGVMGPEPEVRSTPAEEAVA